MTDHDRVRRALRRALALNGGFMVVELLVGLWSGSLALTSDAAHMFGDTAALALALVVAELARRPRSPGRTFGLLRSEALGAFANALLLLAACVVIVAHAAEHIVHGPPTFPALPVLAVAVLGLLINLGSALVLARSDSGNINVRGALLHMLADALGSIGAILAALLAWRWDLRLADPIISLGIAALIAFGALAVLRDAATALLDFTPRGVDDARIAQALAGVPGVAAVHELHLWAIGPSPLLTAHLVPAAGASPAALLAEAERVLRDEHGIHHSTLQVDPPADTACPQEACPLFADPEAPPDNPGHHHHAHNGHHHHAHAH